MFRCDMPGNRKRIAFLLTFVWIGLAFPAFPHGDGVHEHQEPPPSLAEHADENGPVRQITVRDEQFELFIEHPATVAGETVAFNVHVTVLETGQPFSESGVHLEFEDAAGNSFESDGVLRRPGIYAVAAVLPNAGTWRMRAHLPEGDKEHTLELPELAVYVSPEEAAAAPHEDAPEGISFLKEQQWKAGLLTETVQARTIKEFLRVAATVRPVPGGRVDIIAPSPGILAEAAPDALPQLGQAVEAGQTLAVLSPAPGSEQINLASALNQSELAASDLAARAREARAAATAARATLAQAERNLNRTRELASARAKSQRDVEEAELAVAQARAALAAALQSATAFESAQIDRSKAIPGQNPTLLPLVSPINGVLGQMQATAGQLVRGDTPIFTVYNLERVLIEARVPETRMAQLAPRPEAYYTAPAEEHPRAVLASGGNLLLLGQEIDQHSRTVPLTYEVPNEAGLRIGTSLLLAVETNRSGEALSVPESALVDEAGQYVVFVQIAGETFEKRNVHVGPRDGGYVAILSGLREGEIVVTHGAYVVRIASVAGALPAHGHAH